MAITSFYEAAVTEGLESTCYSELRHRFGGEARLLHPVEGRPGSLQFTYDGNVRNLLTLKTVLSIFWVHQFDVPRPRAMLGHENFHILLEKVEEVRKLSPKGAFQTIYLAAAGSESKVMTRFLEEMAQSTGLKVSYDEGDLLLRMRRPLDGREGWDVMIRLTPRPLSTRDWRVCDYKGALNASVAHVMALLTQPRSDDIFLNIACGSGSILIERAWAAPFQQAIGCDTNEEALACARQNKEASGRGRRMLLYPWDARSLPLSDKSVDVLCSDLPFGHHIGSHKENIDLYPRLMAESARVAKPGARCVFLTHEIRLMTELVETTGDWVTMKVIPLTLNGLHPRIYVMERL